MRVTFHDFEFDTATRLLARRGAPIALTPKAAALLDTLIAAAPSPVTKEKIYDVLWKDTFVEGGNLHNLVSELRAALGDGQRDVIRTVHRVGYAFSAPLARLQATAPRLHIGNDVLELASGDNIIGRERLGTPDVSRRHARIHVGSAAITIEDLESKNGTFVRGERIERRTELHDGDEIVFGRTRATLRVVDAGARTVTAGGPAPISGSRGSARGR